ncbi:MAG: 23S rRNA (pseudouridine(1915)-N(3))-methyltransferase RlmH [Methanotrichaceae archaeon]|nr:23S rRNA (pseudouridine(1915)-N(3))-methyltransferase RlmH [Methanotrichaceae archaeon]
MMLRIIAVGRLRERYWQEAISDYVRRLRPYGRVEIVEVPEARIPDNASPAEEEKAMAQEAEGILARLKKQEGPVVVLDRKGKALDSLELAEWLGKQLLEGPSEITWIIGGPLGLDPSVLKRSDLVISFSRLTFPHQMMRLILLEQIYRSFRIIHREPYHK